MTRVPAVRLSIGSGKTLGPISSIQTARPQRSLARNSAFLWRVSSHMQP